MAKKKLIKTIKVDKDDPAKVDDSILIGNRSWTVIHVEIRQTQKILKVSRCEWFRVEKGYAVGFQQPLFLVDNIEPYRVTKKVKEK